MGSVSGAGGPEPSPQLQSEATNIENTYEQTPGSSTSGQLCDLKNQLINAAIKQGYPASMGEKLYNQFISSFEMQSLQEMQQVNQNAVQQEKQNEQDSQS